MSRFVGMKSRRHRVFLYGTLQRGQPNHFLLTERERGWAEYVGRAETVESWPLVVATTRHIPFLLNFQGRGRPVCGDIYEIDDKMLEFLDHMEGHPDMYMRHDIRVRLTHDHMDQPVSEPEEITVHCYVLKRFKPELLSLPNLPQYDFQQRPLIYTDEGGSKSLEDILREEVWT